MSIQEIADRRNRLGYPVLVVPRRVIEDESEYMRLSRMQEQIYANLEAGKTALTQLNIPPDVEFQLLTV